MKRLKNADFRSIPWRKWRSCSKQYSQVWSSNVGVFSASTNRSASSLGENFVSSRLSFQPWAKKETCLGKECCLSRLKKLERRKVYKSELARKIEVVLVQIIKLEYLASPVTTNYFQCVKNFEFTSETIWQNLRCNVIRVVKRASIYWIVNWIFVFHG